jgi:peptidyl-dipeptidase Dcp
MSKNSSHVHVLDLNNPFAVRSTLEYELPPFERIRDEHYLPAFYAGMQAQLDEVEEIINSGEPSFENTIVALEKSGQLLMRVATVFFNKSSSDTSPVIDRINEEMAPKLAAHNDAIKLNPKLFSRIQRLYNAEHSQLSPSTSKDKAEDAWLLEKYHRDFLYAGAALPESNREELKTINSELSQLTTRFARQILADTNASAIVVESDSELDGLSANEIVAAKAAAVARDMPDKWLINAVNFTGNPLLASLKNRELRERIMKASIQKGNNDNDDDNKTIVVDIVKLRARRAQLFGATTHAEYVLREQTAVNPANVHAMMQIIAPAAVKNAKAEGALLQDAIIVDGQSHNLESWDWAYYAEKVRQTSYTIDAVALAPYFELERVLHDGIFYAATRLFGLTFKERHDLVTYHPEARAFEVNDEDGSQVGLFIADFYTRDSKRGGAWMNNLVDQNFLLSQLPVVCNNLNIPKPPAGEPTLISFDFLRTLFHEFGHALHGLLSQTKYPRVSGTNVQRDFVEFPSQVNEMWMLWPEVVDNYAYHYKTGEKLPQEWIENIHKAQTFNQGFLTSSYLQAAILDLAWHELRSDEEIDSIQDVIAFESNALAAYGFNYEPVPPRYRTTYFSHIFAGGYSAGYYGYIWSEVLDADTVEWFKENGGLKRELGDRFRRELLSRGGSIDSKEMYRNFRGADPDITPLLKRRGLHSVT